MDDMDAFERLLAEETRAAAGPPRPTDVAAVVRAVATKSPRWRIRSMFGTTRMLVATPVVALVAGLLLVGSLSPSPEPETTGAEPSGPRADPVEFEGRWSFGGELPGGEYTFGDDGWYAADDLAWAPNVIIAGDPRLDGQLTLHASTIQKDGFEIWNGAFRIEGEAGAWQQRPMIQSVKLADERDPMTWTAVFDGEGEYAGLTAIMGFTRNAGGWDIEGVVVDGTLPPVPTALSRD